MTFSSSQWNKQHQKPKMLTIAFEEKAVALLVIPRCNQMIPGIANVCSIDSHRLSQTCAFRFTPTGVVTAVEKGVLVIEQSKIVANRWYFAPDLRFRLYSSTVQLSRNYLVHNLISL